MDRVSWEQIRHFLTVAELGSVSAAARELNISQPTLSRHIQLLERQTKLSLFQRSTSGLQLTDAGADLVETARKMSLAADQFDRQVKGTSTEFTGAIRLSATQIMAAYILPPALAAFQKLHPKLHLEIDVNNLATNLHKRDADIALRMFKPSEPDLVCRRLPDIKLGFYAHQSYVEKFGLPNSIEELKNHNLIGFDKNLTFINQAGDAGMDMSADDFSLRTDCFLTQLGLMRAGAGIAVCQVPIGEYYTELRPILPGFQLPPLECWLVAHPDVQVSRGIKALMTFLADWFDQAPYQHLTLSTKVQQENSTRDSHY